VKRIKRCVSGSP